MFEILLRHLSYPESPEWSVLDQCIYFVEWGADRLSIYREGAPVQSIPLASGAGPSAVVQDGDGSLWLCLYSARQLVHIDRAGKVLSAWNEWQGQPFKGPNDLALDRKGGLYFTDSGNFEQDWRSGDPTGALYRLTEDGDLYRLDHQLCYPNGIALSPHGRRLFVNEHRRNRTLVYDLHPDGTIASASVFYDFDDQCALDAQHAFELGPDGMDFDASGLLWVAHYGGGKLAALDDQGQVVRTLHLPQGRKPTNLCCSASENVLYITEAEYGLLYRVRLDLMVK